MRTDFKLLVDDVATSAAGLEFINENGGGAGVRLATRTRKSK